MTDIEELKRLAEAATPGPWVVQTGNSWRRIGSAGDGDVLCPVKHPHDGWPDLSAPHGNLEYIAAADPQAVLALIRELEEARKDAERYRWLKQRAKREGRDGGWIGYYSFPLVPGWDDTPYSKDRRQGFHHVTLDEAIDAARQKEGVS